MVPTLSVKFMTVNVALTDLLKIKFKFFRREPAFQICIMCGI